MRSSNVSKNASKSRNQNPNARSKEAAAKTNSPYDKSRSINKKELKDYSYFLGTAKQASEYESTTLLIINHIKKEFEYGNDIASALDELKEFEVSEYKPVLQKQRYVIEDS